MLLIKEVMFKETSCFYPNSIDNDSSLNEIHFLVWQSSLAFRIEAASEPKKAPMAHFVFKFILPAQTLWCPISIQLFVPELIINLTAANWVRMLGNKEAF